MASARKKRIIEQARKRRSRGRIYLLAIMIVAVIVIGVYVYVASLPAGPPDFNIAAPTGITINTGSPVRITINVTAINRFSGTVHLSATPSTNLTASITPPDITGQGTAELALSTTHNGTYTVAITGTSGSLTHTVSPSVATPTYATLLTSNGTITVELFRAQTPQTVANFVKLANSGFYKDLVWHRIVPGFVIQTGDPTTVNGTGDRTKWGQGTSQSIAFEYDPSLHNTIGYLGMASTAAGAGGSCQFYINLADNSASLDGKYAVFGKVISGMNAVNTLAASPTTTQYSSAQAPQPSNPAAAMLINIVISSSP